MLGDFPVELSTLSGTSFSAELTLPEVVEPSQTRSDATTQTVVGQCYHCPAPIKFIARPRGFTGCKKIL
jgi:hypothetical protein